MNKCHRSGVVTATIISDVAGAYTETEELRGFMRMDVWFNLEGYLMVNMNRLFRKNHVCLHSCF